MSRSSPCDILLLTRKCCSENEEKALLLIRSRSVTDDLEQQLSARQGGSVCITSRWEPSRCSSPTWRGPLVCFSSWVSATPTCWRSTANSSAQHSNGGTVTRWTHKEMPSSWLLLTPAMPSQVQWLHNVPSPRISGPKEWSCVSVWVYIQANQRFSLRLHQFLVIGVHPLCLAFCLLVDHHIHSNLFPGFCLAHLEDVQNQTSICANYSTTLCEGASIIPPDREHASLLLRASWTFLQEGTQLHCLVGL